VQQAYVDANFKEGQLRKVRIGQPVDAEADLYGGKVKYRGTVIGIGRHGLGLRPDPRPERHRQLDQGRPALPVRIAIDPKDLKAHPLRVGLSMKATIDNRLLIALPPPHTAKDRRHGQGRRRRHAQATPTRAP
jgi:membrane fusion protein (multidrug efflux system)